MALSIRKTHTISFVVSTLLVAASLYFEFILKLEPCPLCILQRVMMMLLAISFLVGVLIYSQKRLWLYLHNGFIFLSAVCGAFISGRQVWLQHLPENLAPACGPGLNYMIKTLPISQTLKLVFEGSGECAKVSWTFLHLSMPEWTLGFFVLFALVAIVNSYRA